jgi:hypothetical protein
LAMVTERAASSAAMAAAHAGEEAIARFNRI